MWQNPMSVTPDSSIRSGEYMKAEVIRVPLIKTAGPADFIHDTVNKGYPLFVQYSTFVTKILTDTRGPRPRAYGVQYEVGEHIYSASPLSNGQHGQAGYALARREVIISGGAFETPSMGDSQVRLRPWLTSPS
jgi:hypothetical protein